MTIVETLLQRNESFATTHFDASLRIIPKSKLMIIGCVDPRVDPAEVLGLEQSDAAVLRNVGGRVVPETLLTLDMLRLVAKAGGGDLGPGWNFVVLHHTDCGITRLDGAPELLSEYFGVPPTLLDACAIHDPRASVRRDVALLQGHAGLSEKILVTGLVYDVTTGRVETVVPTSPLRGS